MVMMTRVLYGLWLAMDRLLMVMIMRILRRSLLLMMGGQICLMIGLMCRNYVGGRRRCVLNRLSLYALTLVCVLVGSTGNGANGLNGRCEMSMVMMRDGTCRMVMREVGLLWWLLF